MTFRVSPVTDADVHVPALACLIGSPPGAFSADHLWRDQEGRTPHPLAWDEDEEADDDDVNESGDGDDSDDDDDFSFDDDSDDNDDNDSFSSDDDDSDGDDDFVVDDDDDDDGDEDFEFKEEDAWRSPRRTGRARSPHPRLGHRLMT